VSRARLLPVALLALCARPAAAQDLPPLNAEQSYASPQYFMGEIKFGPYRPNIDSEFASGSWPYQRFFGNSSGLLMAYELDYEFFQKLGTAAVGFGLAYWTKSAHTFPCASGSGITCEVTPGATPSGDTTSLQILPLSLLAIYRFDWAADNYRIPIVPYAKFGLTYSFWWIDKGNGKVSSVTVDGRTENGRGAQFGLTATFGAALQLDALDPGAGRELDGQLGINHTYLFWEWTWWGADGLGSKNALHIGDSNWLAGLSFEF
jgi:hypothetical protein